MSEMVTPNSFNCSSIGANTVIYTITDNTGAFSSCSAVVTVEDGTAPSVSCPGDMVVNTNGNSCEADLTLTLPTNSDNCGVTVLRYRYREVDGLGDNIPGLGWSGWTPSSSLNVSLAEGNWKIEWQAKDAADNQNKCSFFVEVQDNTPPNAVCYDTDIVFNGESDITLLGDDVWNEMASSDNCGQVNLLDFSPAIIDCSQIGTVVPVTVQVEDASGNPAQCTSNITVSGLPCGWSSDPDGIGCPGGSQASFDPNASTFTVSSDGCYNPNYYSPTDTYAFLGNELCGNGEIIAEVTQVTGSGFAGIMMRNDLTASSTMLRLGVDGVALTKRGMRVTPGAPAFNHLFQTQGKNWLRLTRSGNQFSAMHSTDGVNWGNRHYCDSSNGELY